MPKDIFRSILVQTNLRGLKMEKVSIIMPAFNSSKYLDQTLDSIMNQIYTDWELLITDDFSTDNTRSIIHEYLMNDNRIRLFELSSNNNCISNAFINF